MSIDFGFDTSFFTGGSTIVGVPDKYDVAINGRPYMLYTFPDTPYERRPAYTRKPIQLLAPQQDNSGAFGENSLSNQELVRRSQDSWDNGAGQTFFDRPDSDNRRFRSSKGIDVWERWALKLLPDTGQKLASSNTNLALAVAGTRLYTLDGANVRFTADLSAWTAVTGLPATAPSSIASDGFNIWTAHGTDGIRTTTRSSTPATLRNTLNATVVGYVKGRLMAAVTNALWNITDFTVTTPPATPTWTHPNVDWRWIGFAAGQTGIYAGGFSGDKSAVYRITIKSDGTGLDVPTEAGALLDGEVLTAIDTYVGGVVVLGTTQGVRFALENSDGTLNIGGLIPTGSSVLCFEGQGQYIWYGLTNYDSTSTGLGRLNPQIFPDPATSPLTPAWATDLMVTGQGSVLSACTFLGLRVLAVSGLGVYAETTNKVAAGILDSGLITYGIPDSKVGMFLDVKVRAPVDTNRSYISVDGDTFTLIGTRSTSSLDPFPVGQRTGETFEVRHELLNADLDLTAGPVLTRWTLRAYPAPHQGEQITMTLDLSESQLTAIDTNLERNPQEEYAFLQALQQSRQLVTLQVGEESLTVIVDDHEWNATTRTALGTGWNGICDLNLKAMAT